MLERIIHYDLPIEENATERQVLRLTIGEMNTLLYARWQRLQRETRQWAQDHLGMDGEEGETAAPLPAETLDRRERGYRRAAMLGALRRVEIGTCALDAEEPTEWQESELPREWQSINGFIDEIPWKLFDLWLALAVECNPGAFFREPESDQKKHTTGQVSVRSSMRRLTIS